MKVYIAEYGWDYEGFEVEGVFDSEAKAEECLKENYCTERCYRTGKECKKSHVDFTSVEEHEVK